MHHAPGIDAALRGYFVRITGVANARANRGHCQDRHSFLLTPIPLPLPLPWQGERTNERRDSDCRSSSPPFLYCPFNALRSPIARHCTLCFCAPGPRPCSIDIEMAMSMPMPMRRPHAGTPTKSCLPQLCHVDASQPRPDSKICVVYDYLLRKDRWETMRETT